MANIIFFLTLMIPITWSSGPNNMLCVSAETDTVFLKQFHLFSVLNIPIFIFLLQQVLEWESLLKNIHK